MFVFCLYVKEREGFDFSLLSMLHELWSGSSKALTSPYFHGVYELSMGEKEVIRGMVWGMCTYVYIHVRMYVHKK